MPPVTYTCDDARFPRILPRHTIITQAGWGGITTGLRKHLKMMTLIWLRVALVCYAAGLLYALVALTRTSEILGKIALHASYLGMVFHFVSLTEAVVQTGQLASASVHNSESLLAF